jgi:hypothetical protein
MLTGSSVIIVIAILAAMPLLGFIYYYARYSPWTLTIQGRTLMAEKVAMLLLVLFSFTSRLFDYPGQLVLRTILSLILISFFWAMFIALRSAQKSAPLVSREQGQGFLPESQLEAPPAKEATP